MRDRKKALAILALNRMIEQGYIVPKVDQISILYWISYEIIENMKNIDVVFEAQKVITDGINKNHAGKSGFI